MKGIEIPSGAKDSELKGWGYTILEGMEAEIKDGKIVVREKESEDERIRKGLVKLLTVASEAYLVDSTGIKKDSYLAYLEKQKENPKSADSIPSDCVSDAKCEDRSPKHTDSFGTDIRDTPAYWRGWDDAMKQKEQNHPNGCFTCDEYKKGYEAGRLNGFTAGYNKAMKEIDQKEQKPAEWEPSEEQMEALEYVIRDYREDSCNATANYLQEILDHLKNM